MLSFLESGEKTLTLSEALTLIQKQIKLYVVKIIKNLDIYGRNIPVIERYIISKRQISR